MTEPFDFKGLPKEIITLKLDRRNTWDGRVSATSDIEIQVRTEDCEDFLRYLMKYRKPWATELDQLVAQLKTNIKRNV